MYEKITDYRENDKREERREFLRKAIHQLVSELLETPEVDTMIEEINPDKEKEWVDRVQLLLLALDVHHYHAWKDRTPFDWTLEKPGEKMLTSFTIAHPRGRSVEQLVQDLSTAQLGLNEVSRHIEQIQRHLEFALDKSS